MGCVSSKTAVETIYSVPPVPLKAKAVPERDFHREYALKEKLGQGTFGVVYAATHTDGSDEQFAVKVIDIRDAVSKQLDFDDDMMRVDRRFEGRVTHEAAMLRAVGGHDNVCRMSEKFIHGGLAYLVLARYGRTLREALESCATLSEEAVRPLFQGMLRGIAQTHARGIVHRDVKPDNFMCTEPDNTAKLCDFGNACAFTPTDAEESMKSPGVAGTPAYMAPEMLRNTAYNAKVDVWSFGVVVHVLLRGSFPYTPHEMTRSSMTAAILRGIPTPQIFLEATGSQRASGVMSPDARLFIVSMLSRSAKERPTSAEALRDEFFISRSLSQICLRRQLEAAQRCGAFEDTKAKGAEIGDIDLRLRLLQDRRCSPVVVVVRRSPASEVSTDIRPRLGESGQSCERVMTRRDR